MLGLKPVTLQNQRCRNSQNKGVPYMKIGHRVWYNLRDIKYYIEYYKERRRKRHSKASLCQRDAFFLYLFLDQTVQKLENSSSP